MLPGLGGNQYEPGSPGRVGTKWKSQGISRNQFQIVKSVMRLTDNEGKTGERAAEGLSWNYQDLLTEYRQEGSNDSYCSHPIFADSPYFRIVVNQFRRRSIC